MSRILLDIITVTGLKCVSCVPSGTPEFVNAFVRSKAHAIDQEVQKLLIVQDPKIHYDLLRFCQHTRLPFLARNVPPDVMVRPADASFDFFLSLFSYRAQLYTPFFNRAWEPLSPPCQRMNWHGAA
jgi:hypothetical protein